MEFLAGLFIGLTFWEFFIFFAFFGFSIWSSQVESTLFFIVSFAVALGGLHLLGWSVFATMLANPITIVIFIIGYLVFGGLWSLFVSWPEFLNDRSDSIKRAKASWLSDYNKSNKTEHKNIDQTNSWNDFFSSYEYRDYRASNNFDKIQAWITTWAFDLIWKAIHKPVTWIVRTIYNSLANGFSDIGKRVTKNILKD